MTCWDEAPQDVPKVGTRVRRKSSSNIARFAQVMTTPPCYICAYFAKPEHGPAPTHEHSFSVRYFDTQVWEVVTVSDVEVVGSTEARKVPAAAPRRRARPRDSRRAS